MLFDYGQTLVTVVRPDRALLRAYTAVAELLARRLGIAPPDAAGLVEAVHDRVDVAVEEHEQSGAEEEIAIGTAYAGAYADLGIVLDASLLDAVQRLEQEAWLEGVLLADGTLETLAALRERGLRLGICSNAPYHPSGMTAQLARLGLAPLLDAATFSSVAGWRKPSPRIFAMALADLGADPGATLFVGDRLREDVDGAHAAGMRSIRCRALRDEPDPEGRADLVLDSLADLVAVVDALASRS